MNLEFDTSKPHTLADLASAHNLTEDEVATNLWRECYIDFGVGLTELGKSKMPGLLFPKWPSRQYGHWDARDYYESHRYTPATIARRYSLKRDMTDADWRVALARAERDEAEWGIILHGKGRFFETVLNGGWEYNSLGNMDWITLHKDQDKWSVQEWVTKLRATGKPWLLFLKRESLEKEIVVLDAEQFRGLLKQIRSDCEVSSSNSLFNADGAVIQPRKVRRIMEDDCYLNQMDLYYDKNVNWEGLREQAKDWTKRAFDALAHTHTVYDLAVDILSSTRDTMQNFQKEITPQASAEIQTRLNWLHAGAKVPFLSEPFVPYAKLNRTLSPLMAKRWFLFQVLKREIGMLEAQSVEVPDEYRNLAAEYDGIIVKLVKSATKLVPLLLKVVKPGKVSEEDLLAEGRHGLTKAAHRYDFERKSSQSEDLVKFSTYARPWILKYMRSAVDRAGFEMSLDVVYGSDEEGAPLSECLDNSSSISTPIPDPEEECAAWKLAEAAKIVISQPLSELEFKVFVAKFEFLNHYGEMTDVEIAEALSITSAKVREILASAIDKVKRTPDCKVLFEQLMASQKPG